MNVNFVYDQYVSIPVMEHFHTVQGEGYHSGRAAFFIRLAGCDVGCSWCDVKDSWTINEKQIISIDALLIEALKFKTRFAVITGGEPAQHNLLPLTNKLKSNGFEIAIETSGAFPLTGIIDWICVSPKKFKFPLNENLLKANELKVIAVNNHDLIWAKELESETNLACKLYIQPEWDKKETMMPKIIDFIACNPQWKISLQTHKYLGIP